MGEYKLSYENDILRHKQWEGESSPPNDGPTQIGYNEKGSIDYMRWHDQRKRLHRVGKPAMVFVGHKPNEVSMEYWIVEGLAHRFDGPAITHWMNGKLVAEEWWINGRKIKSPGYNYNEWPLNHEQQIELKLKYG